MMPEDRGADHIVSMVRKQKDMTACSQLAYLLFHSAQNLTPWNGPSARQDVFHLSQPHLIVVPRDQSNRRHGNRSF